MLNTQNITAAGDEQLMRQTALGNEQAFDELYKRHSQKLFGFFF